MPNSSYVLIYMLQLVIGSFSSLLLNSEQSSSEQSIDSLRDKHGKNAQ